jgi:hypothetical protein
LQFLTLQRGHASAAGDTGLAGKIFGHSCFLFYCAGRMSTWLTGHSRTLRVQFRY